MRRRLACFGSQHACPNRACRNTTRAQSCRLHALTRKASSTLGKPRAQTSTSAPTGPFLRARGGSAAGNRRAGGRQGLRRSALMQSARGRRCSAAAAGNLRHDTTLQAWAATAAMQSATLTDVKSGSSCRRRRRRRRPLAVLHQLGGAAAPAQRQAHGVWVAVRLSPVLCSTAAA